MPRTFEILFIIALCEGDSYVCAIVLYVYKKKKKLFSNFWTYYGRHQVALLQTWKPHIHKITSHFISKVHPGAIGKTWRAYWMSSVCGRIVPYFCPVFIHLSYTSGPDRHVECHPCATTASSVFLKCFSFFVISSSISISDCTFIRLWVAQSRLTGGAYWVLL